MDMHSLAVSICMTVVAVLGGSDGLIWTEESTREEAVIQICLGEEVSLFWQFITDADETVVNVEWYKNAEGIETILAIYNGGQFFRSPVTHLKMSPLPNAGLHVANLTWADYGTYSVRVKVVKNGGQLWSISREAIISPPDAPVLAGGRLVAQRVRVPVTDKVTGELHMQLKCGAFLAFGSRPLSVVWKTPSGQTVPSTERSADSFFLTLPNPIEGGTYSCHLENHTALQACVKNAQSMSSLKRGAFVQLDEAETQLSILGAQAKTLFSRDQDVRSSLKKEVIELREELSERKKTEQDLQRQVEVLSTSTHDVRSAYTQLAEQLRELEKQQSRIGDVYVRWGSQACPDTAEMVYSGVGGGGHYQTSGAPSNLLCLPRDPVYDDHPSANYNALLYGAEYETRPHKAHDLDVVCAVCVSPRPLILMIPATNKCHPGWISEYSGYLMAGHQVETAGTEYVCMDKAMEGDHASSADHNGKLFYFVIGQCGSLPCPPYVQSKVITCVVCSK